MATAVQVESILGGLTDNSGQPLAAGRVYTYAAGSTTPINLYTSSDKSTSATNPLVLDGYGKAQVWADGRYKFVVKDQYDVTQYTLDNLLYGFDDSTVLWGGQSTGSANVHNVTVPATVGVYSNGQRVSFLAAYTNTGATTLQLNALGAVNIVKGPNAVSLQAGDIVAGQLVDCVYEAYSGTGRFRIENYPSIADVQASRFAYATNVGGTNVIVAELSPAVSSYEAGLAVRFKATASSTGAVTINLNSLGSKAVQRYGVALVGGEIKADDIVELVYDGASFQLVNASPAPLFVDRTNNRIGVGTTAPADLLEVAGTSFFPQYWTSYTGASSGGTNLMIRKSRGATVGTNTIVANGDVLGSIDFAGANGTNYTSAANIAALVDGEPGASNDMPGRLIFQTTPDSGGSPVERMRIDSLGNIGLGAASRAWTVKLDVRGRVMLGSGIGDGEIGFTRPTTANQTAWNISVRTDVGGSNEDLKFIRFINNNFIDIPFQISSRYGNCAFGSTNIPGENVKVHVKSASAGGDTWPLMCVNSSDVVLFGMLSDGGMFTGTAGSSPYNLTTGAAANMHVASTGLLYRSTSSLKYKTDITDAVHGLADVLKLRSVTYKGINDGDTVFGGLIAEEVDAAGLSEFVQYADDGTPDALAYGNMVALAFKAIQELNAKVEELQARVGAA